MLVDSWKNTGDSLVSTEYLVILIGRKEANPYLSKKTDQHVKVNMTPSPLEEQKENDRSWARFIWPEWI